MADVAIVRTSSAGRREELSLWALAVVLLRHRILIGALAIAGGVIGYVVARAKPLSYSSSATFIPEANQSQVSGLALAASQFGITLPTGGNGTWGPPMYLELIRSRELLEPILDDTVVVRERGNVAIPIARLLPAKASTPAKEEEQRINLLRSMIAPSEAKTIGGVQVRVTTPWPSVSLWLTNRVVQAVNDFNIQTRKSQSIEELQFVTAQEEQAERALRAAENNLQSFLQSNRVFASPQLTFERDRLQREVDLRQELQTSWLKSREDARIRAVRETPVITVFEHPRLPLSPEPRYGALHAVLGFIVGGTLGILVALLVHVLGTARDSGDEDAQRFFALVEQSTPRFLRRVER